MLMKTLRQYIGPLFHKLCGNMGSLFLKRWWALLTLSGPKLVCQSNIEEEVTSSLVPRLFSRANENVSYGQGLGARVGS